MEKNVRYVLILSFFLAVSLFGLFKVVNFDFGWHLKAGELIWSERAIPRQDVFSYIAQGKPWIDSHWLFQLVLYLSYILGGLTGTIILRIFIILLTFLLLFGTVYRKEYTFASIAICLFALFMSFQRFLLRPEIFSLLFLAAFFFFMENFSRHPRLSLITIPVLQIAWTNMHGLHVLGVIFLALYLLGDLLQVLLRKCIALVPETGISASEWSDSELSVNDIMEIRVSASEWRQKGLLFGLTCLSLLVNANGKDGILYPYKIFTELRLKPTIFAGLTELISPFDPRFDIRNIPFPDPSLVYKIFLILSLLVLVCQIKRIRFAHVFLYGAFFYLSTQAIRNVPLFAMVAAPMTIRNTYGILDFLQKHKKIPGFGFSVVEFGLIILSVGICLSVTTNKLYHRLHLLRSFGVGISDTYPAEAVHYLKSRQVEGNIFNSSDIGGYLIWQLYPEKQVAFDGRWEVYGDLLNDLERLKDPLFFAELQKKYNIGTIVLYKRSWEMALMAPWLQISPFWEVTNDTAAATVYELIH